MKSPESMHGLYAITDTKLIPRDRFAATVEAAVRGGASMVQLREKDVPMAEVIRLGQEALAVTRRHGALLIVNDHPQVALEIGADGVHVGRDGPPVAAARDILGPDAIVGVSCYGEIERATEAVAAGADYVVFGTPFPSITKEKSTEIPLDIFQRAKQLVAVPMVAIGGINLSNARPVIEAGADTIAVVSGVFGEPDVEAAAAALAQLFR